MSSFKSFSLIMAVASSTFVVLLLLLLGDIEVGGFDLAWRLLLGGVLSGGLVGGIVLIFGGYFSSELFAAAAYIDDLSKSKAEKRTYKISFGIDKILRQVEETVLNQQQKYKKLQKDNRDIKLQRHIAEEETKQLNIVFDSLNDAVVVTDAFNEIVIANTAAEMLFGFDINEVRRQPIDEVVENQTLCTLIRDTREGSLLRRKRQVEQRIRRANIESIYDITLSRVQDENWSSNRNNHELERMSGVVAILRDITREREIAESKSDFVSNVSHELRTPLSSIKAYMEMLVDGEADDEKTKAKFYNIIQGEANRLSRLIDNILNISRIESGVVRVQREHIALAKVIREAVNIMQPQARAKQIELVETENLNCFQVFADRDMVLQCVLNLLSNAVKYTPVGGKVSISVCVDERARVVKVAVKDNGVGISEEDIPHLFDKFYRVADHKKLAKGTGLGLNLVRHVIETVHGGEVSVKSSKDIGSTFTFALPIADEE